jgi:hypothetical protein
MASDRQTFVAGTTAGGGCLFYRSAKSSTFKIIGLADEDALPTRMAVCCDESCLPVLTQS